MSPSKSRNRFVQRHSPAVGPNVALSFQQASKRIETWTLDDSPAFAESAEKLRSSARKSNVFRYDSAPHSFTSAWYSLMTRQQDPVVSSSFREALIVISLWLIAMIWTITVCYQMGYDRPVEDLKFVYGFPDWVFWGIVVPWCVCTIISCFFSAFLFRDGNLGEDVEDADDLGLGG